MPLLELQTNLPASSIPEGYHDQLIDCMAAMLDKPRQVGIYINTLFMNSMKLVFPLHFISLKTHFLILAGSAFYQIRQGRKNALPAYIR